MDKGIREGWLQRHVLLAAIVIPVISVLMGTWVEQASIWSESWRQLQKTSGTMSPFVASAHTLATLAVQKMGGYVFKAWSDYKQRMADFRAAMREEGREQSKG